MSITTTHREAPGNRGLTARPCHEDPEAFFPADGESDAAWDARAEHAMSLCGTCPYAGPCRRIADATHARTGVWGGVNYEEMPPAGMRASPELAAEARRSLARWLASGRSRIGLARAIGCAQFKIRCLLLVNRQADSGIATDVILHVWAVLGAPSEAGRL